MDHSVSPVPPHLIRGCYARGVPIERSDPRRFPVDTRPRRAGRLVAATPATPGVPAMADSSADRDPLDRLAEEFVARYRSGERPALADYCARHPHLAGQIRELFPALVELEQL